MDKSLWKRNNGISLRNLAEQQVEFERKHSFKKIEKFPFVREAQQKPLFGISSSIFTV